MKLLFVGEKRSATAIARGWTWADGRLASHTLHQALTPLGLSWADYMCVNILEDSGALNEATVRLIHGLHARGTWKVVALGRRVTTILRRQQTPLDASMIHPAARGRIRTSATYQAHVRATLSPFLEE